jgi:hypothetical protein
LFFQYILLISFEHEYLFNMKFTCNLISLLAAATSVEAFAPALHSNRSISSYSQRNAAVVSADDINAKLAAQMQKLKEKDASSTQLSGGVSTARSFAE